MKLVNVLERMRGKKELIQQIAEIAPEYLKCNNVGDLAERLREIKAVTPEEITYREMRLMAKVICLMVERVFENHGYDVMCGVGLVDRDNDKKFGYMRCLSYPHIPEELAKFWNNIEIKPFVGSSNRAVVTNKVVVTSNVKTSLLFTDEQIAIYEKYGIKGDMAFPVHFDSGEVIGVLYICSTAQCTAETEVKGKGIIAEIRELVTSLEHLFTLLQESWVSKDVVHFRGLMTPECVMVYVDPVCKDMLGYGPAEMIGGNLPLSYFVHPDDREQVKKECEPLLNGKSAKTIFRALKLPDEYVPIEVISLPIKNPDGSIHFIENHCYLNTRACKQFKELKKTATL